MPRAYGRRKNRGNVNTASCGDAERATLRDAESSQKLAASLHREAVQHRSPEAVLCNCFAVKRQAKASARGSISALGRGRRPVVHRARV
jgi:hypothetical protein